MEACGRPAAVDAGADDDDDGVAADAGWPFDMVAPFSLLLSDGGPLATGGAEATVDDMLERCLSSRP